MDLYSDGLYMYGYGYGYGFLGDVDALDNILKGVGNSKNGKGGFFNDVIREDTLAAHQTVMAEGMGMSSVSINGQKNELPSNANPTVSVKNGLNTDRTQDTEPSYHQLLRPGEVQVGRSKAVQRGQARGGAPNLKSELLPAIDSPTNGRRESKRTHFMGNQPTKQGGGQRRTDVVNGGMKRELGCSAPVGKQMFLTQKPCFVSPPLHSKSVESPTVVISKPANKDLKKALYPPSQKDVKGTGERNRDEKTRVIRGTSLNGGLRKKSTADKLKNEKNQHDGSVSVNSGNGEPFGVNVSRMVLWDYVADCRPGGTSNSGRTSASDRPWKASGGGDSQSQHDCNSTDGECTSVETVPQLRQMQPVEKRRVALEAWAAAPLLMFCNRQHTNAVGSEARPSGRVSSQALQKESTGEQMELDCNWHNVYSQLVFLDRHPQPGHPSEMPLTLKKMARRRRARSPRSFYGPKGATLGPNWFRSALDCACRVNSPDLHLLEVQDVEAKKAANGRVKC